MGAKAAFAAACLAIGGVLAQSQAPATALTESTWDRVEESSGAVLFEGAWRTPDSSCSSGGKVNMTARAHDHATFGFVGSAVRLIGIRSKNAGKFAVSIDGARAVRVDGYAARKRCQQTLWQSGELSSGAHTIRVWPIGQKNRRARAANLYVDAFDFKGAPVPPTNDELLSEDFESYVPGTDWPQDRTRGPWYTQYSGYGSVGPVVEDGSTALKLAPAPATSPDETHAAFVTTSDAFGDIDLTARMRTVSQLRRNSPPNPWEVAWLAWNYRHDHHFYYFILKPNGWELGKVDNAKVDPDGPACLWPEYRNCVYDGAQVYLATNGYEKFPVGPWYEIRVVQVGAKMTISVDGRELVSYTDTVRPYTSGAVGLYTEDADVRFDDVVIRNPATTV